MEINVLDNNIVVIFSENITNNLKTDAIELLIADIYSEKNPKPIINKFPEQVFILIPETQNVVLFTNATAMFSDQSIGEFARKDSLSLVKFCDAVTRSLNKNLISYGFNFVHEVSGETFDIFKERLLNKFNKSRTDLVSVLPQDSSLDYILPTIVLDKEVGSKHVSITIKFGSVIDNPLNNESDLIRIQTNVHFIGTELPALADLSTTYTDLERYISTYVLQILGE